MSYFFRNGNRYLTVGPFLTPLRCTWSRTPRMSNGTPSMVESEHPQHRAEHPQRRAEPLIPGVGAFGYE